MEENLSRALMMAAEILIGILLLTIMVYIFSIGKEFTDTINDNIQLKAILEFNAKFEKYNQKQDLTAQDVVTLANMIKDYNSDENIGQQIQLEIKGIEQKYITKLQNGPTEAETIEFMQSYAPNINDGNVEKTNFKCVINYDENGVISLIQIERLKML